MLTESICITERQARLLILALQELDGAMEADIHGWEVGKDRKEIDTYCTTLSMLGESHQLKQTLKDVFL